MKSFLKIFIILLFICFYICFCKQKAQNNSQSDEAISIENTISETNEQKPFNNPETAINQDELDKHLKENNKAVIFVYEDNIQSCVEMEKTVSQYIEKNPSLNLKLYKLNRKNTANNALIEKYNLASAPLPVTLIRIPEGGILGQAGILSEEQISSLIPSYSKGKVISAIQKGKSVVIHVNDDNSDQLSQVCNQAKEKLKDESEIIKVSMLDEKEKLFLKEIGVVNDNAKSSLIVFNKSGQLTDRFLTLPTVDAVVDSSKKVIRGGCNPGACGSGGKGCPLPPGKTCPQQTKVDK